MIKNQNSRWQNLWRILFTIVISFIIGSFIILAIGENPFYVYYTLLKGSVVGTLGIGSTLAIFTPMLLSALAFAVAAQAGGANVGVEGEIFLGGLTAAYIAGYWTDVPKPLLFIITFLASMIVGAIWAFLPGMLRAYLNVSEICVTILMNSVAINLCSFFVSGPMSAGATFSQSPEVQVKLTQFYRPSRLNTGIFIAVIVFILCVFIMNKTTLGFKIKNTGTNARFTDAVGLKSKKTFVTAMMMSGAISGLAGCIEILGVHGAYIDNFATGIGTNGMLISLISNNSLGAIPFMSFFLAMLKNGSMAMQQATNVPKSIVDMISALFIIFATLNIVFKNKDKIKLKGRKQHE